MECRLKTSCTPPETYPDFEIVNTEDIKRTDDSKKVQPHAFVHFALPKAATWALNAAGRSELFFNNQPLKVTLGPVNPFFLNQRRRTTNPYKLADVILEIGSLVSQDDLFVAWRGPRYGVDFLVDPFEGTCRFCFTKDTAFSFKSLTKKAVLKCDYKVEFLVRDINEIREYSDTLYLVILLQLSSPPCVWYRTADDDIEELVPFDLLDDDDPWITTDFTPSGALGRCNAYRLSIPPCHHEKLKKAMNYLKERRVQENSLKGPLKIPDEPDYGMPMSDPFFCIHYQKSIDFETLFLVNAVMHKGIFNQHQLCDSFFNLLRNQSKEVNVAALKHICSPRHPVFDATTRLKMVQDWLLRNPKLYKGSKQLDNIIEVRRLVITPSKAYCLQPEVELSNRVLRRYKELSDRFLRVTFMDEGMQTINSNVLNYYVAPIVKEITSNYFPQKTKLRDRSAWFFAEEKNVSCDAIRDWMGKFNQKNVAKCAARMGQCFSSTYATVEVPLTQVNSMLPDIERNGYVFSDGIGTITPDLADEVAEILKLEYISPCAYQIRYAGFKGVVACWPAEGDGIRLSLRPSMNKFQSHHTTLEICSWSRFQPGFLNRQIIILLLALDVPDEIFWEMQEEQGNAAAIMLSAGFNPQSEPHLRGMLASILAALLWGLREKARIFVSSGQLLMGVLDELNVLEQGQCFIQVSTPSLENCFLKHGSRFSEVKKNVQVIKGFVVIAKNPCLHPGDIRILEAVDIPSLHHLCDCLVFPQKGDRPHTNETAGSDLDGDLYFVTWDENLIPPSKKSCMPMQYDPAETKFMTRKISPQDIIDFFVRNMVNEQLGVICNAHVVHADHSDYGALDEKCIVLAELAATAVDFPKTGKLVTMPSHLKPKLYPDFLGKDEWQSYKSTKILGRLYRQIKDAYTEDVATSELFPGDIPYDTDLDIPGAADFIMDAWDQKCSYDRQLSGLLGQYKVKREEEVITGHIWSMPKYSSRKQGDLKERLKHSYSALKKEFRQIFERINSNLDELSDAEKNIMFEQKASAWYQVTYHPNWVNRSLELQGADAPQNALMLSFPWIAADYIAQIKIKNRGFKNVDSAKPIHSLVTYLAGRL
ncbi:RNA-dependent RNA polymerase [Quillaja saponaria]|uniref:RNA-dependent RNA polymerase n=1 Tax=Quillaja saponaria TaxID=32244 RepID=A0AAD7PL56_QUISA|nr:RNA-dependent RNA polymerase [Quillaja saponaria]